MKIFDWKTAILWHYVGYWVAYESRKANKVSKQSLKEESRKVFHRRLNSPPGGEKTNIRRLFFVCINAKYHAWFYYLEND